MAPGTRLSSPVPMETWEIVKGYQFILGTRPVITLCGHAGDFVTLVGALDTSSPKRRLLRIGLLFAARLHLLPAITRSLSPFEIDQIAALTMPMHRIAAEQGTVLRSLSVLWPAGDRHHRRYITGIDGEGTVRLFSKVTVDPDLDWHLLRNEGDVLAALEATPLPMLRTPRVFRAERDDYQGALVMEAIPPRRQYLGWLAIRDLLPLRDPAGGRTLQARDVPWLKEALNHEMSASFRRCADEATQRGMRVGLVNGDMRPSNVVLSAKEIWIFDWEYAAQDAPAQTDLVAALLNARTPQASFDEAADVLAGFIEDVRRSGLSVRDAALSLLYLSTVAHPWALLLMKQGWVAPTHSS